MQRAQISLTVDRGDRFAEIARDLSVCEAEVVRRALDRALGTGDAEREDRAVIASTSGLLADYPDWPEWLSAVRGQSADERPLSLGL